MAILLDSHAFVWWLIEQERLSPAAFNAIQREPDTYVSAVVAWELAGKVRLGKWAEAKPLSDRFFEALEENRLRHLPITLEHAHLAGSLPGAHRDPFDRMLAAQAILEAMPLVTADPAFRSFAVETLW
jgi:PIN domain nuclease of toxin-antitoxin system